MKSYIPIKWKTGKKWINFQKCNLPRLNEGEIENMNRSITDNIFESVKKKKKKFHHTKIQDETNSQVKFTKRLKKRKHLFFSNGF